jgi:dihydroorotase (multifunctional complex type)
MFDLGIEGGTLVTGAGRMPAHLYVSGGRIAAISAECLEARERVDATGLLVMPGMIDTHVHLMDPGDETREDFPSGTAAAARAGVTTIIEHTHSGAVREVADLQAKVAHLADRSRVDFGLAAHAFPDRIDQVEPLWRAGATFFKAFTCTTHGIPGFDAARLRALFTELGRVGAPALVHGEDDSITAELEAELRAAGRDDNGVIPEWRHPDAELVALSVVATLAKTSGARIISAHLSRPDAIETVSAARATGAAMWAESCPQYLTLLAEEVLREGALRKFTPPARAGDEGDLEHMWAALAAGEITHISSDHAPSTREQKADGSIWDVHFGLPGIDTTMPILLDAGARGLISYERLVACYSEEPARIYGIAGKGRLEPGADADVILVDPAHRWTVTATELSSKAGWSPFEGRELTGRTVRSYLRGELIAGDGFLAEPGVGRFLPGAGARSE